MGQSINLIPQTEVKEQTKSKVVKMSTVLSILLLIVASAGSFYLFYEVQQLKEENTSIEGDIENLRKNIQDLSSIEITTRNLDKKHRSLKDMFASRLYYSDMLLELRLRTPAGINLRSFSLRGDDEINLSGKANDYVTVSRFTSNLLEAAAEGSDIRNPFSSVTLNAVSLDSQDNTVNFAVTVGYNEKAFQK